MRHVLLSVLLLGSTACALPRSDGFYVQGAALPEPFLSSDDSAALRQRPRAERGFVAVRGHRIGPGSQTVLAYRRFWTGNWFAFDDERFEKLTIALPDSLLVPGRRIDLARHPEVLLRYTESPAVWVDARCYGTAREGWLAVRRRSGAWLEVEVQASVELVDCGRVELRRTLVLERRRGGRLSPWEGRAGWTGEFPTQETLP